MSEDWKMIEARTLVLGLCLADVTFWGRKNDVLIGREIRWKEMKTEASYVVVEGQQKAKIQ